MKKSCFAVLLCSLPLLAQRTDVPRHIFSLRERLTAASAAPPRQIAKDYLRSLASGYGLSEEDLRSAYLAKEYRTAHNGVTHLVFRQRFQGVDVENADWVVNIDRDGQVINAGGRLYSQPSGVSLPEWTSSLAAVRTAVREVNPKLAERYFPFQAAGSDPAKSMRFARGGFGADIEGHVTWYAAQGVVHPAWSFTVVDEDGLHSYAVIVESNSRKVLAKNDLTLFQNAQAPRGLVFEQGSPQPNPKPGVPPAMMPPIVPRTLQSFAGDPKASPKGWVSGTATAGNNVIAGTNPLGNVCLTGINTCYMQPLTTTAPNLDFSFSLQLGPGAPNPTAFSDAVTVNLFYWLNRAHDMFYALGFDEAVGNFQEDNFGKGGTGGDSVYAYAQFGVQRTSYAALNNAGSGGARRNEDGARMYIVMYVGTLGDNVFTDSSLDAEVIVHEYTHGVTQRLVPGLYTTDAQGRAMGEGWSDFLALELLTPEGTPADGVYTVGSYFFQALSAAGRTRPYSTNFDVNPLTYANLGHVIYMPEPHADGEIWMEALWEARGALIKQFGEKEGRRRMRLIAMDSLKLSTPAPSMIDARDAVLLADQVDFKGTSQDQIWAAFARRGLGVLAQSGDGNSVHISPSFEVPSSQGVLGFYEDKYAIGEDVRIVLQDANLTAPLAHIDLTTSSGDLEKLELRKKGSVYYGTISTGYAPVLRGNGILDVVPGDAISAYYVDMDTGQGAKLIQQTVNTYPSYAMLIGSNEFKFAGETALYLQDSPATYVMRSLPFEFPFFGKTYNSVRVYNNGILTFDLPDFSPCSDVNSLRLLTAIAPMWMIIRTDGLAQSREDVYESQTADSVTFRWAGETAADFSYRGLTASPSPVNFAATLHKGGEIEFSYGSGNNNLTSGSQLFGCPAGAATVGISNGHETFAQIGFTHDSQGSLQNAPTLFFQPSQPPRVGPRLVLESPVAGETVQGVLSGKGIIYETEDDVLVGDVYVLVDGIAMATATTDVPRRDFCADNDVLGCPNVGFTFGLGTEHYGLKPGPHTLQLRGTNTRGGITVAPVSPLQFNVEAGEPVVPFARIEAPADGATVSGRVPITGYFALPDARVSGLDVIIDGINYGGALYGLLRAEACSSLPGTVPGCPGIGFTYNLNTAAQNPGNIFLSNGKHSLQIRARDQYNRFFTFPDKPLSIVVNNSEEKPPKAVITSPAPNQKVSGTLHVSGYAYDPDGKVNIVRFYVDDFPYSGTYGAPRPEICASLTDAPACPNIGFDADIDTRALANGPHYLSISVTDNQGRITYVPGVDGGINFMVQN